MPSAVVTLAPARRGQAGGRDVREALGALRALDALYGRPEGLRPIW